ncbi:MAG: GntR family transcriptional regulator [Victivallales bacterium]
MRQSSKHKDTGSNTIPPYAPKCVKRGSPDYRTQEITADLKEKIISGKWKPGMRIPTRRQLCAKYVAGPITIQNIIAQFEEDGFLKSDGRNGTCVVKTPPHMVNVALVFPEEVTVNRFWNALSTVAREKRSDGLKIIQRFNISHNGWTDNPDQVGLISDILRKRLLGVFFASIPFLVEKTPIVTEPGIPRCAIITPGSFSEFSQIFPDAFSFQDKALGYLKSKGRKRIAVVGHPGISKANWPEKITEYGFESGPYWIQGMNLLDTMPGYNLARLLFHDSIDERPDGLVITDDNLVESVTKGIAESGVRFPKELDVIAHCNFPCIPPSSVPVVHLGYDTREFLDQALRFLRAMRMEGAPPVKSAVKAVFEDELKPKN